MVLRFVPRACDSSSFVTDIWRVNLGLIIISSLVIKECFRYVRYGAKFKKLCEDCDVLIDNGCLRFDISFNLIQSLSRYVVCSPCSMYSVCPVFCRCISSTFVVNKQHI